MKLIRTGKIKENEAKVLLEAIKEKGELVFPLNASEVTAVIETLRKAEAKAAAYSPSLIEIISAQWNYSFASVASFALWLGASNIKTEATVSKDGRPALKIQLRSNNQIEWDALKASAFRAPLI